MVNERWLKSIIESQTTFVWHGNVLYHIFTNHNWVNCKENTKFSVINISCFEATLLMDSNCVSNYSWGWDLKLSYRIIDNKQIPIHIILYRTYNNLLRSARLTPTPLDWQVGITTKMCLILTFLMKFKPIFNLN